MTEPKFPLQQGGLDFMCGIYAAINAMVLRKEIDNLNEASIPFRLAIMFMQSRKDWNLAEATCFGVGEEHYFELLNIMSWREWRHYSDNSHQDMHKKLIQLMRGKFDYKIESIIVSLVDAEAKPYKVGFERDVNHYTVVTGANIKEINICDSQTLEIKVEKNNKLMYGGKRVKIGSIYIMTI